MTIRLSFCRLDDSSSLARISCRPGFCHPIFEIGLGTDSFSADRATETETVSSDLCPCPCLCPCPRRDRGRDFDDDENPRGNLSEKGEKRRRTASVKAIKTRAEIITRKNNNHEENQKEYENKPRYGETRSDSFYV